MELGVDAVVADERGVCSAFGDDAGPEVPMLYLLGSALAAAINSATDLIGRLASMTRINGGPSTIQPIIAKSSTG